ncbi:myo-inositol 2-dehydrogenase [Dorea sp. 5-2]|jgi:myo-inositol 2-dehydrogenase/D-chiro-inositol 1-dehydrogenase|nr:myo-inositol 2-dehydrogenase [Dorea sp. 5-2]
MLHKQKGDQKIMVTVGIIGAGRIGRVHVESICTKVGNAKIKALADPFMNEETDLWAKKMGVEITTKDYKEILADPEIDAVLICSSTDTHSPISVEAIQAGKHVFCEKPIDHDVAKIKEVIDALAKNPVKYQVGFNRRFDHNFEAVRDAVAAGKIGDTHIIKITSRDPEPPCADYVKVSGGMFLDMTIHDFDMVRFLAGCNAAEVYVEAAVLVDPAIGEAGDVDTAVITLKMENGAIAVIDNSRQAVYGYDQRAEVFGSKGMVATGNDTASAAVISNVDGVTGEKPLHFFLERYMDAYAKEIKCFIEAIENDTETPLGVDDGLQPVLMGLAAKKSLEEHRPVKIAEVAV